MTGEQGLENIQILRQASLLLWILGPWGLARVSDSPEVCRAGPYLRIMREIIEVPLPLAASSRFISFLTFHISMFFSASFA